MYKLAPATDIPMRRKLQSPWNLGSTVPGGGVKLLLGKENRRAQVSAAKIGVAEIRTDHVSQPQIGVPQISTNQVRTAQTSPTQVSTFKARTHKVLATHVHTTVA